MKLAICEYPGVEILLRRVTQIFVLAQNLLEHLVDVSELFIRGVVMAINLILHLGLRGRNRDTAHNIEEDWPVFVSATDELGGCP